MVAVPSIGRASLVEPRRDAAEVTATHGLYERHAARIHGYCLHQLGSREEAEDAVQTTFMNAFRALRKGVVPEAEAAWLFKIAENVCLSRRRSSWRRNRIESPADFAAIEEIVPGPNRQRDELIGIEDALASMPEQQRRAILLREWQGLSYREIAAELELSQSAVETLIFRARRSLAQGLTEPHKPQAKRKGFRRALHAFDVTTLLAAAKSLLAGSAAVKATTAAVAVTAIAGGAATVAPDLVDRSPKPPLVVVDTGVTPAASALKAFSRGERRVPAAGARASASVPELVPVRARAATARPVPRASKPVRPAVAAPRRGDTGRGSERRAAKPKPAPSKSRRATTPASEQPKLPAEPAAPRRSIEDKPAPSKPQQARTRAKAVTPKTGLERAPSAAVTRKAASSKAATSKAATSKAATSKAATSKLKPEKPAKAAVAPAAAPETDADTSSDAAAVPATEPSAPNGRAAAKAAKDK